MLSDTEILKLLMSADFDIVPFSHTSLGPMSYDLHVRPVSKKGEWTQLVSIEIIRMPRTHYGILAPRSRLAKVCTDVLFGTLIDPGFSGKLLFAIKVEKGEYPDYDNLFQMMVGKVDGVVDTDYSQRKTSTAMNRTDFGDR